MSKLCTHLFHDPLRHGLDILKFRDITFEICNVICKASNICFITKPAAVVSHTIFSDDRIHVEYNDCNIADGQRVR